MSNAATANICLIIGDPVSHSLSPRMHSAAYRAVGLEYSWVYGASRVPAERLGDAIAAIRGLGIRGISVTMPHKEAVIPFLDIIDAEAQELGAVNTIVNDGGVLTGYNTDWVGVATPLAAALEKTRSGADHQTPSPTALILGAGGAARAAAFALRSRSIPFTVTSRTLERASLIAKQFGGRTIPWDHRQTSDASIIINTTPLGMAGGTAESPLSATLWRPDQIAFETVSVPRETPFLADARAAGATVIPGIEMLLWQGVRQFELFTRVSAPVSVMADVVRGS